jgi:IS5 family transposase
VTAANESDVANAHALLHGLEHHVHADSGYTGVAKREEIVKAQVEGRLRKDIDWHMTAKRGTIVSMAKGVHKELTVLLERKKAQIRARVEHSFHVIKNLFGHKRVSYKHLAKNRARMFSLFALANLVIVKRPLLQATGIGAS